MVEFDIRKQLEEKNKEIYLNKLNLDLTNNIEVLGLTIENLLNNIENTTKDRILNIAESFQNESVIKQKVHLFIEQYKENLVMLLDNKHNKIKNIFSPQFKLSEYQKCLQETSNNIKEKISEYFLNNIESLKNDIINLYDDSFCRLRINEYLNNVLKDMLEEKIMDTIISRDVIMLNTFQESFFKYLELNEKTTGIKS